MKRALESPEMPATKRQQTDSKEEKQTSSTDNKEEKKPSSSASNGAYDCPICFTFMSTGKIFQCINGHIFCEACSTKMDKCGECRACLATPIRCLVLEKFRDALPKICRHKPCEFIATDGKEATLLEHERDKCEHRSVWCWCENPFPVAKLLTHMRTECTWGIVSSNDDVLTGQATRPGGWDVVGNAYVSQKAPLLVCIRHARMGERYEMADTDAIWLTMTVWRIPTLAVSTTTTISQERLPTVLFELLASDGTPLQSFEWMTPPLEFPSGKFDSLVCTRKGMVLGLENVATYPIGSEVGCRFRLTIALKETR